MIALQFSNTINGESKMLSFAGKTRTGLLIAVRIYVINVLSRLELFCEINGVQN
jgi:hypothetical protein